MPVYVTKKAKETECQKCRKYYETVPTTKWVKECNPVWHAPTRTAEVLKRSHWELFSSGSRRCTTRSATPSTSATARRPPAASCSTRQCAATATTDTSSNVRTRYQFKSRQLPQLFRRIIHFWNMCTVLIRNSGVLLNLLGRGRIVRDLGAIRGWRITYFNGPRWYHNVHFGLHVQALSGGSRFQGDSGIKGHLLQYLHIEKPTTKSQEMRICTSCTRIVFHWYATYHATGGTVQTCLQELWQLPWVNLSQLDTLNKLYQALSHWLTQKRTNTHTHTHAWAWALGDDEHRLGGFSVLIKVLAGPTCGSEIRLTYLWPPRNSLKLKNLPCIA